METLFIGEIHLKYWWLVSLAANYQLYETKNVKPMLHEGFNQQNKTYIWKNGNLYRLPFFENKRAYGLLKCKRWKDGFIVGNQRKSKAQLQGMTTDIEVDFTFHEI